jgi:hypothetical protein
MIASLTSGFASLWTCLNPPWPSPSTSTCGRLYGEADHVVPGHRQHDAASDRIEDVEA